MSAGLIWRLALRELSGGARGFRVFFLCLALGVAAIASVGMLRGAIEGGLSDQGAVLLGGDARMKFSYRTASEAERAWMDDQAIARSEVIEFRSMLRAGEESALTQVKAVDGAYPLLGEVELAPAIPLAEAFAGQDGLPGAVLDPLLIDRLGLEIGTRFELGGQPFVLMARLLHEPDNASGGFGLGPRSLIASQSLQNTPLLAPGALYDSEYRLLLPLGHDLEATKERAEKAWRDHGMRWADSRRAAPAVERFVDRISAFLVLVGLAGLAVGGSGITAALRAWITRRRPSIATLKTLGATSGVIIGLHLIQVALISFAAIASGIVLGIGLPWALAPLIEPLAPMPVELTPRWQPVLEASFYGLMTVLLFALIPLAQSGQIRPAALYRETSELQARPSLIWLLAILLIALVFFAGALAFSGAPWLTAGALVGVVLALAALRLAAAGLRKLAQNLSHRRFFQGKVVWRSALAAIASPRAEAGAVVLSLGLGLLVLATIGQIDANLRNAIARELPQNAPSYFLLDLQNDQLDGFMAMTAANPAVSKVETAPMLRGVVTQINGEDARKVAGDHWVLRGDRGLTYAAQKPERTVLTQGEWWADDYAGPPLLSFARKEAEELGIGIGDRLTINVLGRPIEAEIANLREVDFATGGIGFVMLLNAQALIGAPHSHIATLYSPPEADAPILREIGRNWPNVTAISVRETLSRVVEALGAIAAATAGAAAVTLLTGFIVLIGAAAAGAETRRKEAAILRAIGASRAQVLASFTLRSALAGAAAGVIACLCGALISATVMHFVMDSPYHFMLGNALAVIAIGVGVTLIAGLAFSWQPLSQRPASVLRES